MAEFENEVEEIENDDTAIIEDEETTNDYSEITEDDYYALQSKLKKAEEAVVKYKKQAKKAPVVTNNENLVTKEDLELTRFVDKNPEYEWKEDDIKNYLKKGLSIQDAKKLVEPDETNNNRIKTKQASITSWEQGSEQTTYTKEELVNLNQTEYNRVMDLKDAWKVVIK